MHHHHTGRGQTRWRLDPDVARLDWIDLKQLDPGAAGSDWVDFEQCITRSVHFGLGDWVLWAKIKEKDATSNGIVWNIFWSDVSAATNEMWAASQVNSVHVGKHNNLVGCYAANTDMFGSMFGQTTTCSSSTRTGAASQTTLCLGATPQTEACLGGMVPWKCWHIPMEKYCCSKCIKMCPFPLWTQRTQEKTSVILMTILFCSIYINNNT